MKQCTLALTVLILLQAGGIALAAAPHEVAGFVLNTDISLYKDRVDMGTAMPVRYRQYLEEVQISHVRGYKTGIITYGTCAFPNRIVRIRLKYMDFSKAFFEELLDKFKARFGRDPEWKGDPFNVVIAWKWRFVDKDGNRISLILQHNVLNEEEKLGNVVKLSMRNLIDAEKACFEKKHPRRSVGSAEEKKIERDPEFWQHCIPR
jgi:hypothetical protein